MKKTFKLNSPTATEECARALAAELDARGIKRAFVALFGEMGVGKTAFSRGFASYFGINTVKSPTYTVVNEYKGDSCKLFHFDVYRIADDDDLYSIGFYDYIKRGISVCEWSENIPWAIPDNAIKVTIERVPEDTNKRRITIL